MRCADDVDSRCRCRGRCRRRIGVSSLQNFAAVGEFEPSLWLWLWSWLWSWLLWLWWWWCLAHGGHLAAFLVVARAFCRRLPDDAHFTRVLILHQKLAYELLLLRVETGRRDLTTE